MNPKTRGFGLGTSKITSIRNGETTKHCQRKGNSLDVKLMAQWDYGEVIKIGTRALISINGKPMLATHWDGYSASLGTDLLYCDKTIGAVIKVAKRHTIDAVHRSVHEDLNRERVKQLAEKHHLTEHEIRDGKRRGAVICTDDYEIGDIDNYSDWAEYQYDIRGKEIYFRPLKGWYPESLENAPKFKLLNNCNSNSNESQ